MNNRRVKTFQTTLGWLACIGEAIAQTDRESDRAKALRIGCLVIFNALAFHLRLAVRQTTPYPPWPKRGATAECRDCSELGDYICDNIDYVPVFDLAKRMLDHPGL